ncbi:MAG: GNAT family N-acetyltransferase [Planctomycetota bacterium]
MVGYRDDERLGAEEYVEFLATTDLGSQYPRQRFGERLRTLLARVGICITARDDDGLLVGVAMGITDHAYFLFLTDLGVARERVREGIGRELVRRSLEAAGGPADICAVTWANDKAMEFYADSGWEPRPGLVARACDDWEPFTVTGPNDL